MPNVVFPAHDLVSLCAAFCLRQHRPEARIVLYAGGRRTPLYPIPIGRRALSAIFARAPELGAALYRRSTALPDGELALGPQPAPFPFGYGRLLDSRKVVACLHRLLRDSGAEVVDSAAEAAGATIVGPGARGRTGLWATTGDAANEGAELLLRTADSRLRVLARDHDGAALWGIALPSDRPGQAGWGIVVAPGQWAATSAPQDRRALAALIGTLFGWREARLAGGAAGDGGTVIADEPNAMPALDCSPLAFGEDLLAALQIGDAVARSLDPDAADPAAAATRRERQRRIANDLNRAVRSRRRWFALAQARPAEDSDRVVFNLQSVGLGRTYSEIAGTQPALIRRLSPQHLQAPLRTPYRLRELELANRIVISPMAQYSAPDGMPGDWHLVHLGSRAVGGAGLVIAEMTCVSETARITPLCPGLYGREQVDAWRRIVRFVHENTAAKIGVQIGHSGRKGSTRPLWEGMSRPLAEGNWPLVAASAMAWLEANQTPAALDEEDMTVIERQFAEAAQAAEAAGFDLIELHFAHGYLMASFLSPLTNRRSDSYGGSLENRLRFPLRVARTVRQALPAQKPLLVRISAVDWLPGGNTEADAIDIAGAFHAAGCDMLVASAGQTTPQSRPEYGPLFQTPFAERIRRETGMPTMAVGAITTADDANAIIAGGRADLCAIGRMALYDPYLPLHMTAASGAQPDWPKQYASLGRFQPALPEEER